MYDWTTKYPTDVEINVYAVYRSRSTLKVWNGSEMVEWAGADIANYDVPADFGGGDYFGHTIPTGLPNGDTYEGIAYIRAGGTPAITDTKLPDEYVFTKGAVAEEDDEDEPETVADQLDQVALGPRRVSGDSGSVEQHSIPDLIALEKHNKAKEATAAGKGIGARYFKFVPPGTV